MRGFLKKTKENQVQIYIFYIYLIYILFFFIFLIEKEKRDYIKLYRWVSKDSGKSYVGSATNLGGRLYNYYNAKYLMDRYYMVINRALLKYGYANFYLEILEYCEPYKCTEREQYSLDLLKPEYNTLPTAGSSVGYKHSE